MESARARVHAANTSSTQFREREWTMKMIDSSDHQHGWIVGLIVKGGLRNHAADERIRCIHPGANGGASKWA